MGAAVTCGATPHAGASAVRGAAMSKSLAAACMGVHASSPAPDVVFAGWPSTSSIIVSSACLAVAEAAAVGADRTAATAAVATVGPFQSGALNEAQVSSFSAISQHLRCVHRLVRRRGRLAKFAHDRRTHLTSSELSPRAGPTEECTRHLALMFLLQGCSVCPWTSGLQECMSPAACAMAPCPTQDGKPGRTELRHPVWRFQETC